MSDHSSLPPSYEELYPGTGDCYNCYNDPEPRQREIRERLGGVKIPQRYVDLMTRDPPPHSTYFSKTQFRSVAASIDQLLWDSCDVCLGLETRVCTGESWTGRAGGRAVV